MATAAACANCGQEGGGTVKLKNCTACLLVKYCSVECQGAHRKQHKKACKKRAAELKDERLYSQGHKRQEGDFCPLCLLAIPFPLGDHAKMRECCMKLVCNGCCVAQGFVELERGLGESCPFCRTAPPKSDEEALAMVQKRVEAKDPEAIRYLGDLHRSGDCGVVEDGQRGFKLWTEAAELGSIRALFKIGFSYVHGVEVSQNKAQGIPYLESAAMRGCADSRHHVGLVEGMNRNFDRAVRHLLISSNMGYEESLDVIKEMFADGLATEQQYAEALKGYQDALEEMKSPQRDEAEALGFAEFSGNPPES